MPIIAPRQIPTWAPAERPIENFQEGHKWTATGSNLGSSNLNDTSEFVRGTQCASITTAGNATATVQEQANIQLLGGPARDLNNRAIRLTFKVDDTSKLRWINFYVGTSAFANNFRWRIYTRQSTQNWVQSGEWVIVTLQWGDLSGAGGNYTLSANRVPSTRSGFTDMRFSVIDAGTGPCHVKLQSVEFIADTRVTYPNGLVSITFDDSWSDVFDNARPAMDTYGFRGTTYTIAEHIGKAGRYTLPQLKAAQNNSGWEVAGHSFKAAAHEKRYDGDTAEAVDADAAGLRGWLVDNGFRSDSFAYPGGRFGKTTDGVPVESIVARYFSTGRSIIAEDNREIPSAPMPHRLRSLTGISSYSTGAANPLTLTQPGGMLDRAQLAGGWLILCFHRVVTTNPTDPAQCSKNDFESIMKAIANRGIPVLPVGEVMK
ncbi:polysaccharide deacetylase family protein [Actinoplanes sp. NPDC049802]|uniref:polysaccharide deacetylase family protein n=1 Tax=Actinoplanes sp. NPDC049802 TaxID=3154742 RepID=UPI0033EEA2B1